MKLLLIILCYKERSRKLIIDIFNTSNVGNSTESLFMRCNYFSICPQSLIEARLLGFADKLLRSPTLELGPRLANNNNNDLETGAGNGTKKQPDVIQDEGDKICFDKMSIIEETQYDNLETCNHSYQKEFKGFLLRFKIG